MFSYEEYYKLYNIRSEAKYRELVLYLSRHLEDMAALTDKGGFRDRMMKFSKSVGEYLLGLTRIEAKWDETYLKNASLTELKNDQEQLFGMITPENYASGIVCPVYMNSVARDVGPVLSLFAAEFVRGAADALCHRRFALVKKIELYIELHKKIGKGQVKAEQLLALLDEYVGSVSDWETDMAFNHRYSAQEQGRTDLIRSLDLREPYYLYELGLPVGETEKAWSSFLTELSEEKLNELADAAVKGFIAGMYRENDKGYRRNENRSGYRGDNGEERQAEPSVIRNAVAVDLPLGTELLAVAIMNKLTEKGYVPFLRDITSTGVSEMYLRDHLGDRMRLKNAGSAERQNAKAAELADANRNMLKGFAGTVRITEPALQGYHRLTEEIKAQRQQGSHGQRINGRYSIGAAEEKRRAARDHFRILETAAWQTGQMERTSDVTLPLPEIDPAILTDPEKKQAFAARMETWIRLLTKPVNGDRPMKALCEALDNGAFLYLQGNDKETDLVVSLNETADPQKETAAQVNVGTALPGGSVYTVPQPAETNGTVLIPELELEGTVLHQVKLTFEEGRLTAYTCSDAEPEEAARLVRDKLLRGADSLYLREVSLGLSSEGWDLDYQELKNDLPETVRGNFDLSLVLGENRYDWEDYPRRNPLTGKLLVLFPDKVEEAGQAESGDSQPTAQSSPAETAVPADGGDTETKEASEPDVNREEEAPRENEARCENEGSRETENGRNEKRRRYSYPLRIRIALPYSSLSQVRVIRENGSCNDILRSGTFVLLGTDQLNMVKYQSKIGQ